MCSHSRYFPPLTAYRPIERQQQRSSREPRHCFHKRRFSALKWRSSPVHLIFEAVFCPPECIDCRIEPAEHTPTESLVSDLRVDSKVEASCSPEEALESADIIRKVVQHLQPFPSPISNRGKAGRERAKEFQSKIKVFAGGGGLPTVLNNRSACG